MHTFLVPDSMIYLMVKIFVLLLVLLLWLTVKSYPVV